MKVTEKAGESIGLHVNAWPGDKARGIRQGKRKKAKGKKVGLPPLFPFAFCLLP
jgi:hypothetical protein